MYIYDLHSDEIHYLFVYIDLLAHLGKLAVIVTHEYMKNLHSMYKKLVV